MAIQVGQILDKYELLEKVGQGGMAVVYRGIDRSLQRTVAIKVLHGHLAGEQEARDRFEREARAVAKLRHENILEIYDFSGKDSLDSYIITEFIDGQTLREFMTDHHIGFPEIGAMITVQLCQALAHAHGAGILHRDIKPENIMIRGDGVVKLMDFGIAQMLDMQRMTVTGQLLGSPAYMAPELLEGDRLDFRTDIFAVGIVLYQLVTGVLPFRGKNPHEILKRIAECRFEDPQKTNPRVGRELGRIISTALARDPDDRFADITEMLTALDKYLSGSGLGEYRKELARFFQGPGPYEMALRVRLLEHLRARGEQLCDSEPVVALELFNRVLNIDPDNREVLSIIERMSRRRRWVRGGLLLVAVVAVGALVLLLARSMGGDSSEPVAAPGPIDAGAPDGQLISMLQEDPFDAGMFVPTMVPGDDDAQAPTRDAGDGRAPLAVDATPIHDARKKRLGRSPRPPRRQPDAALATAPLSERTFALQVAQRRSEYRVDRGPWQFVGKRATFIVGPGPHTVDVRNTMCCEPRSYPIAADAPSGGIHISLGFLPAKITPRCNKKGVRVQIDDRPAKLDSEFTVFISSSLGRKDVKVTFIGERTDTHVLKVLYNEDKDVTCRFN